MPKSTCRKKRTVREDAPVVLTSAEILPDGSVIEVISAADSEKLLLLRCSGERSEIAQEIRCGGRVYRPIELHSSLRRALRLPAGIADFVDHALFGEIVELQQEYGGLSATGAFSAAVWDYTTWFADVLVSPPPLVVSGIDLGHGNKFFCLNRCFCRRGLILADFSRQALTSLPMELRPTLMIAQPDLSKKIVSLCNASNYRNTFIPARGGTVLDVACSKALFIGANASLHSIDHAIQVCLPPASSNLARLDDRREKQIADKYLPQLLRNRLNFLRRMRGSGSAKAEANFATADFAGSIKFCLPDEPAVTEGVGRLLHQVEEDRERRLWCDLGAAIVEVLWTKLQDRQADIGVGRIAEMANSILRSRGEIREYSAAEVGWQLRQMGIPRHSGRDCNSVRFSQETWWRVHKLAQIHGLRFPPHPNSCIHCAQFQNNDNS